mmetsp:Transcript_106996/g.333504  ORF Transcript_106996/g.333504 Transcript_106996/m.333504 type:complete len:205 (-) Transcript_106996:388-1002(-)
MRNCCPTSGFGSAAAGEASAALVPSTPTPAASRSSAAFSRLCRRLRCMPASERRTLSNAGAGSSPPARPEAAAESRDRRCLSPSAFTASASCGCEATEERRRREEFTEPRRSCKRLAKSELGGVAMAGGVASPSTPVDLVGVIKPAKSPVTRGVSASEEAIAAVSQPAKRSSSRLAISSSMTCVSSLRRAPLRRTSFTFSMSKP